MKSLGNIKGFVSNLMGLSDDTEPLRKRFKCNRVYDDFSSDEEVQIRKSKWSKTSKLHLLNIEKRKPIKSSTIKQSNVIQMLSETKELTIRRVPTKAQPVVDAEVASCSRNVNTDMSTTSAEMTKASEKVNESSEIDSNFNDDEEDISDSEMVKEPSISLKENNNHSVLTESFEDWLKKLNAEHKAYMENTRKSINDILQKYSCVPKVYADNETSGYRSTYGDLHSELDAKYNKTDEHSTLNNMSIDEHPRIDNNSKSLNESNLIANTKFGTADIPSKSPEESNTDNKEEQIFQNLSETSKTETFDEWCAKIKAKYKINLQIKISNDGNVLQPEKQPCQDWLTNQKSQVNNNNEEMVLQVNKEQNQNSLNQPTSSDNQLKLNSQCKEIVHKSIENHVNAPQNSTINNARTKPKKNDKENQETLVLPDLTPEQEKLIDTALMSTPPDEVLIEKFKLRIYKKDLETLSEQNWLNDMVIDFYMNLIMQRSEERKDLPKVYASNTSFYSKLMESGHTGLKRWTRKVDIFAYDLLVIPVYLINHWCISFINFRTRKIEYLDSRLKSNQDCLDALLQYLKDEHQDKKGVPFDDSGWELECLKGLPEQLNSSDCGIFVCTFAEFSSRNAAYTFTQAHMPYLRRKAALEILTGKLLL